MREKTKSLPGDGKSPTAALQIRRMPKEVQRPARRNVLVAITFHGHGRRFVPSCQKVLLLGSQCFLDTCEQLIEKRRTNWKW